MSTTSGDLSSNQKSTLIILKKVFCYPSLVSSILTIFLLWYFKEINNFSRELIFYLCLMELLYTISLLLPFETDYTYENKICVVQAVFLCFTGQSKFILIIIISFVYLTTVINPNYLNVYKFFYRIVFLAVCTIIPFIFALIFGLLDYAGNSACYCFLDITTKFRRTHIIKCEIIAFTIKFSELVILIFIMSRAKKFLYSNRSSFKNKKKDLVYLSNYSLICIICCLPGLINLLVLIISFNNINMFLMVLQIILQSSEGTLILIVYIRSPFLSNSLLTLYDNLTKKSFERTPIKKREPSDMNKTGENLITSINSLDVKKTFIIRSEPYSGDEESDSFKN